jgi:hypothetical protein
VVVNEFAAYPQDLNALVWPLDNHALAAQNLERFPHRRAGYLQLRGYTLQGYD